MGIIYIAINKINKKAYIGQTNYSLESRIRRHYADSIRHTYKFANALRKYGKEDWNWNVLYDDIPQNQLNDIEKWCIANYDTFNKGYNSTKGGDYNPMYNPVSRKKVSDAMKGKTFALGRKHTEESKMKMSLAQKGKKFSEEHKNSMSRAKKGVIPWDITNKAAEANKKTYKITFPSGEILIVKGLHSFCKNNGLDSSQLVKVAKGKRKHHKHYKCEYYN